jgi:uncharacterized protein YaiE (UPF0345 family)
MGTDDMADDTDDTGGAGGESDTDKAVKALAAKNAELLEELKKTRAKARDFEAAEAERQKQIADAEEEKARKSKDWETIEKGYKEKLSKTEADAFTYKARYESLVIDRGLDEALAAAKVNPALAKAAHALIKAEHGVELSDDGKATIGGKALADFVGEWSKSDTGKAFVINGNSGGGSNGGGNGGGGGGDKNPFKAGSINLTEQGRLLRSDPTRAKQLAAEAGVKL